MTNLYNGGGTTSRPFNPIAGNLNVTLGKGIVINDKGDMVGHYAGGSGDFYWPNGGSSIDIGSFGGRNSEAGATGINDSDVVVETAA